MPAPPDDRTLVHAVQGGDRAALDVLLRRHYDRVYAVCRRVTGNDADAADAAQEALLAIVRGLARFDGRSALTTWIYRIATNASLDELRRRRRRPMPAGPEGDGSSVDGHGERSEHIDHRASARIDAVADRLEIDVALLALPVDFRTALVLRDVGDLGYAEIAEVLEIPIGTVKSRIARARSALVAIVHPGNRDEAAERPTAAP